MAPGHLPGHSRMEEKVSLMEDNACDSFVPEDISPFPLLFHQDALTSFSGYLGGGGVLSFVLASLLEDTVLPSGPQPSPPHRERTLNKSTPIHSHTLRESV